MKRMDERERERELKWLKIEDIRKDWDNHDRKNHDYPYKVVGIGLQHGKRGNQILIPCYMTIIPS